MSKVMLVEDDNNLREIYEARLQAEGYTIVSARDGEEALVIAKQEQPDLIISDVMMPKISGFEMLDILRNTDGLRDTKVIMLTALGQSDDQQRADKLGADRYLVKSQVTLEDIVKVTHDLLGDTPAAETPPPDPSASPPAPSSAASTGASPTVTTSAPSAPSPPPAEPAATIPVATEPVQSTAADADEPAPVAAGTPFSPVEVPEEEAPAAPEAEPEAEPAEPVSTPEASATDGLTVQSAAQEEASVEAKIEDFVAGASSEATLPGAEDTAVEPAAAEPVAAEIPAEPAPATESVSEAPAAASEVAPSAPTAAEAAATVTDDKLMADAVNTLVSSTEPAPATAEPTTAVISTAQSGATTSSSEPVEPPAPSVDIESVPTETVGDGTTIAHKKIIKPIDSEPKQDLDVLLAKEAAKQAAEQPAAAPTVVVATNEAGPVAPASPAAEPGKVDPNSIAL